MPKFPAGTPQWIETELDTLAAHNELHGITPGMAASAIKGESGFEAAGAGINSEGYGGYFGLSTASYTTPTGHESVTRTDLLASGPGPLAAQAKVWSGLMAEFEAEGLTPVQALNSTLTPSSPNTNSIDTQIYLQTVFGSSSPATTGETHDILASSGSGTKAKTKTSTTGGSLKIGTLFGFGFNLEKSILIRGAFGILGIILLIIGLKELFTNHSAGQTIVTIPQQTYKSAKGSVRSGRASYNARTDRIRATNANKPKPKKSMEKKAEGVAEKGPVGGASGSAGATAAEAAAA